MRILLVEDTEDLAEAIVRRVRRSGHAIDWEADGALADEILRVQRYDLVVLDITLPGRSGYAILKGLRRRNDSTPVLVLPARSEVDARVSALGLGADGYLVKPLDLRWFEAPRRALLRRPQGSAGTATPYRNMV